MRDYINTLEKEFRANSNALIASGQKAYLKNQFEFYGIKTPDRRELMKPFFEKNFLPPKKELNELVRALWLKPQREYQYFAQELVFKYKKQFRKEDMDLFEFMVTHKSWWDTVDMIAAKIMGEYFKSFPEERKKYVKKWLASGNMWLQRSALLFQLKYKKELDTVLLSEVINKLLGSKEFFINKAIGWILREYSRTNPDWVEDFVNTTTKLNSLSKKEALRLMKK